MRNLQQFLIVRNTLVMEPSVPLIHHDPGRSKITDPDPDHPKGTHPKTKEETEK